jgi:hypothetical protein
MTTTPRPYATIDVTYSDGTCAVQDSTLEPGVDLLINDRDTMRREKESIRPDLACLDQALGHLHQMDRIIQQAVPHLQVREITGYARVSTELETILSAIAERLRSIPTREEE